MSFGDEHEHPLGFLIGTWRGEGVGAGLGGDTSLDGRSDYPYAEMLRIYDDGSPWLAYTTQIVSVRDGHWIHSESGWWRDLSPAEDGSISLEFALTSAAGITQILVGALGTGTAGPQIELVSDVVARTPNAPPVTAEKRLYAVRGSKLLYAIDQASGDSGLSPHLAAALERVDE